MASRGWIIVWAWLLGGSRAAWGAEFASADLEFFETHVRPVLVERCYECHSGQADEPDAGLRLDSRAGALRGGDNGPAVVPGELDQSRLLRAISYNDVDLQMPPDGKLPDETIEHLREWVRRGAPWPDETTQPEPATETKSSFDLQARKQSHWAWQPLADPAPPEVRDRVWPRQAVDEFILARLEAAGIQPAAEADRHTWLRRVTFDLIGLPPTVEEVDAFVSDSSPDAYEKVVDRLLASPHFGERWARHWLDLVRYAETKGHEFDYPAPNAWEYRDYVIRAFNADVPYDQFVIEHIAGDLLPEPRLHPVDRFNESMIGTGFWFLGEEVHSPVDTRQDQADRFDNRIDVLSKTFLGLTVNCARCHDHKFDAISSRDYYALFGFLESSSGRLARFDTIEQDRKLAAKLDAADRAAQQPLRVAVAQALQPASAALRSYLLAARNLLADDALSADAIARERGLDASALQAWSRHLRDEANDTRDPFHVFAKAIARPAQVAEAPAAACEPATASKYETVVDYANLAPGQWLPDDVSYGLRPRPAGSVWLGLNATTSGVIFQERAAAVFDPVWDVRTLAAEHQLEPGAVGNAVRPGRTICTPNFTVHGKVYSLVRGAGQVYATVDQHSLVNGPLHGQLVGTFNTEGAWRWVERDLTEYAGHTAHLEFTPAKDQTIEISAVVQGDAPPELPVERLNIDATATVEDMAAAYRERFTELVKRLQDANTIGDARSEQDAWLANWALRHASLFADDGEGLLPDVAQLAVKQLEARSELLRRTNIESRLCMAMQDNTGVDEKVFLRGSWKNLGVATPRRGLEALYGPEPLATGPGSGRLEFAEQLIDTYSNPLVPRVIVNRVWHHLFGRGIVASVDNFGVMGETPTHPELLDFLARRLIAHRWQLKPLIRELTLSSTYRLASSGDAEPPAADPRNLLLHHARVRRLEGEAIRDAMLQVCGSLDRRPFGRSVKVYLDEFMEGRGRPAESGPLDGANRRSIYLEVRRNFPSPMMLAFDTPIPFSTVGRRSVSNVPAQSLVMLNDPLVHELAERWAKRTCDEVQGTQDRIERMYMECFGRPPTDAEQAKCEAFIARSDENAWKDLAHALWNVKEFVFVE